MHFPPTFSRPLKCLVTLVLLAGISQLAHADDSSYDEEGERRAQSAGAELIGQPGPTSVLTTVDGDDIDLTQLYGKKPVYLKFWATWCVPCRQQMPGFEEVQQTLGDKIQVIAVNTGFSDDIEAVRAYREELGLTMPITIDDGSLAKALNLRVTPQHVLIGKDGRIAHVGHLDNQQLHSALRRVTEAGTTRVATAPRDTAQTTAQLKVGDHVKDLHATTLNGTQVELGQADTDRPLALVFFAPWCESYLAESRPKTSQACQRVRETADKLAAQGSVEWLGISSGLWASREDLLDYQSTTGTRLPLALDEQDELFRAFGIRDIPSVVLLDTQGRVTQVLGPDDSHLADAIDKVGHR